jgi:hypothetical protein
MLMKKNLQICFTFIESGSAHILINPGNIADFFSQSGCKEYPLDSGHYFIFYNAASAGGGTITVLVDGTQVATKTFAAGSVDSFPISLTI